MKQRCADLIQRMLALKQPLEDTRTALQGRLNDDLRRSEEQSLRADIELQHSLIAPLDELMAAANAIKTVKGAIAESLLAVVTDAVVDAEVRYGDSN
jgi:hypothetical protein